MPTNINPFLIQRRVRNVTPAMATTPAVRPVRPVRPVVPDVRREIERERAEIERRYFMPLSQILRTPRCISMTVGTTPTLILEPPHEWPYLIVNPALVTNLTSSLLVFAGTVSAAGNTQGAPIGVANFLKAHFHLDITAVTGNWDLVMQSRDPRTGRWADVQVIFSGLTSVRTSYANVGDLGVVLDLAVRWIPVTAGSITFSLMLTLKEGTPGGAGGASRAISIGGGDVTMDSGILVREGERFPLLLGPDLTLFAVAPVEVPVQVFTL